MPRELEERLERLGDVLPEPTAEARDRARNAALAALQDEPRRRRRALLFLLPAAVAVVGAVVAVLATPWRESPLATDRALAALGDKPVVHAIVEQQRPLEIVVDLKTGEERRIEVTRAEYWYDDERDSFRVRLSVAGRPVPGGEFLQTPEGSFTDLEGIWPGSSYPPRLEPALERFARGYREALASGDATVVGEKTIDGRDAIILRFSLPGGPGERRSEEVAVDKDTYRPLRVRSHFGHAPRWTLPWSQALRIVEIATISRDPRDFEPPKAGEPRLRSQKSVVERTLTPRQAATALGRPVFWPGRSVAGVSLAAIELMRLTTTWTDGRVTHERSLMFSYGADRRTMTLPGRYLVMRVTTSPEENPGYDRSGSPPRPGELRLSGSAPLEPPPPGFEIPEIQPTIRYSSGAMQRDGVYVTLDSRNGRELIVAAAKALKPLG